MAGRLIVSAGIGTMLSTVLGLAILNLMIVVARLIARRITTLGKG
ncbi:hypothetical protein [Rhizobium sp. CC-YZS058]